MGERRESIVGGARDVEDLVVPGLRNPSRWVGSGARGGATDRGEEPEGGQGGGEKRGRMEGCGLPNRGAELWRQATGREVLEGGLNGGV